MEVNSLIVTMKQSVNILVCVYFLFYTTGMMETEEKSLYDVDPEISSAVQELDTNAPNLKVFTISNIKATTNNFSRENKLAEGGFGPVYKVIFGIYCITVYFVLLHKETLRYAKQV